MELRNKFRGVDSTCLRSLAGQYKNRVVVPARQAGNRFLGSIKGLQIRALVPATVDFSAIRFHVSDVSFEGYQLTIVGL
jgi:hypothetical protein